MAAETMEQKGGDTPQMRIEKQIDIYLTKEDLEYLLKNPGVGTGQYFEGIYIDVNHEVKKTK